MNKQYHLVVYEVKENDGPLVRKCIIPISGEGEKIKGFENYDSEVPSCTDLMEMLACEGGKLPLPNCSLYSDGFDGENIYWVILEQEVPPAKGAPGDDKAPRAREGENLSDVTSSEDRG